MSDIKTWAEVDNLPNFSGKVQDFEFYETPEGEDAETVEIQFNTLEDALKAAQVYANKSGHRCYVISSIANIFDGGVEYRDDVEPEFTPIEIIPISEREPN